MNTPRVAILAGLFVAGGLAGAGGTALLTAEAETVDLIAGGQVFSTVPDSAAGPTGGLTVTIDVYNPDQRSVNVAPVAIGGWDVAGEQAASVTAAGQAWTPISFEVIPDCEGDAEATLDLATDDVASEVALTDEAVTMLSAWRGTYCGDDGIVLEPTVQAGSWDGESYALDVRLPGHGRGGLGDLTIDAVTAGVPFMVEAQGLPATLPAEGAITLTTRWTFDCEPDLSVTADPVGPGGEMPYEAMYLTTSDGIQIHADVSTWLVNPWGRACAE